MIFTPHDLALSFVCDSLEEGFGERFRTAHAEGPLEERFFYELRLFVLRMPEVFPKSTPGKFQYCWVSVGAVIGYNCHNPPLPNPQWDNGHQAFMQNRIRDRLTNRGLPAADVWSPGAAWLALYRPLNDRELEAVYPC